MKYLIFLAIVVQALAGPAGKPEKRGPGFGPPGGPLGPKPSHPPPIGDIHPFDDPNVTGQPPHNDSSRPPPPKGLDGPPIPLRQAPEVSGSAPPNNGNPPPANGSRPAGGPPPAGKPPAGGAPQGKPGQGPKPRPKRHLKGDGSHPTGAPHLEDHTHLNDASRPSKPTHPANGMQEKHGAGKEPRPSLGNKGHKG